MIPKSFSRNTWALIALAIIGVLVHGTQAGKLGLYWDDAYLFLHSLRMVDGDIMSFILRDSTHFLPSERPLAYLPHMVSRASFVVSLSMAHWILITFWVLTAVVLAILAQKLVRETWFSFAVGVVFLTYPLAPITAIRITGSIHYPWAVILTLIAILFFLRGLNASQKQRLLCFIMAALFHFASMLTHEGFILIPPMFVSLYLMSKVGQERTNWKTLGLLRIYWPAVQCLGLFLTGMTAYAIWREIALPYYGYHAYSSSSLVLKPQSLALKFVTGLKAAFVPWDDALTQILLLPPLDGYLLLSGILAVAVWVIILRFRATETRIQEAQEVSWIHASICGVALAIAGIAVLALSPSSLGGVVAKGYASKVNFTMTIGIALSSPAFLALLTSQYKRFSLPAGLLSIAVLLYIGFTSSLLSIDKLFLASAVSTILGGYSLKHKLGIFGYLMAATLLILMVILSSVLSVRWMKNLPIHDKFDRLRSGISTHFVPGAVACLVFFGSLFHFSVKEEYIDTWNQHKSMLEQLQRLAPALQDHTFVVIVYNPPRLSVAPFITHFEHSSFLEALYANNSISGNTDSELRFHRNGVESTYYGKKVIWEDPGANQSTGAGTPIPRIAYERLLIFEFDGRNLRMLPKIEVKTEEGQSRVVLNNPDRILSGSNVRTVVWRYLN